MVGSTPPVPLIGTRALTDGKLQFIADYDAGTFSLSRRRRRFGEWLVDRGLASQADIDAALAHQAALRYPALAPFDALAVARLLETDQPRPVSSLIAADRLPLLLPSPQPAPPLGDLLVRGGILPALQPALAGFLDPFWH